MLGLFFVFPIYADDLVEDLARKVAGRFLQEKTGMQKRKVTDLQLFRTTKGGGYVFIPADGRGFVWVLGNKEEARVVGYSLTSDVSEELFPQVMESLSYPDAKHLVVRQTAQPIPPLLSSVWEQTAPYNGLCPYYRYDDGTVSDVRCLVGCVATATSEIMRYHAHPKVLQDTLHGWKTEHYRLEDVLPNTPLDWANMLDTYTGEYSDREAQAVQELALYCGMACRMNYGVNASGSNTYKLLEPLHRVFGYEYAELYDRSRYSPTAWRKLLQCELQRGVPLVYVGYNLNFTGHAFVLDGMDDEGFFHIRWGEYGGIYNGYFDIDILNPHEHPDNPTALGRDMGLFCNQSVLAFHPDALEDWDGDTLTYRNDEITVESFKFRREPNTKGYVTADVRLKNHSIDTITYTLLAFTTDTPDSIDWAKATEAGITAVTLYPGSTSDAVLYCQFKNQAVTTLGLTGDQQHILHLEPIEIKAGQRGDVCLNSVDVLQLEASRVRFGVKMTNESEQYWDGGIMIYTLYHSGSDYQTQHWTIMNLAPGEELSDTVQFSGLQSGAGYRLQIHSSKGILHLYDFTTPGTDGLDEIMSLKEEDYDVYTMAGVRVACVEGISVSSLMRTLPKGIYLVVGSRGTVKKISNH